MNCICGCGRRIGRGQLDTNLIAGEVAMELVVWDKARSLAPAAAGADVERMVEAGAQHYQRLLAAIHDGREPDGEQITEIRAWLGRSQGERLRRHEELGLPKRKIKLSSGEEERIDRRHPELTFSVPAGARVEPAGGMAPDPPATDRYLEALLTAALEDVRAGRTEEAERALRRFLSERG